MCVRACMCVCVCARACMCVCKIKCVKYIVVLYFQKLFKCVVLACTFN